MHHPPATPAAAAPSLTLAGASMLSRLRIGPKLLLAPGVVLALLVLLSSSAYLAMVRQNRSLDSIALQRAVHMRAASDQVAAAQKAHAQAYQVLAWTGGSFARERIELLVTGLRQQHAAIERGFAALARLTGDEPAGRRCVEQARAAWRLYVPAVNDVIEIARLDQSISANAMSKAERAFAVVALRLTELARREQALSEQASSQAEDDFRLFAILMPVVIALSIAASLAITIAVRRSLLTEIDAIQAAAQGLASGDLTIRPRIDGEDEIAVTSRALDASIRSLSGTLRTILESARSIGSASREIALGRAGLPPRAGVRDALERTACSMQELAQAMHSNADSALAANRVAEHASAAAQQGGGVVHRLVTTMEDVRRSALRLERQAAAIDALLGRAGALALDLSRSGMAGEERERSACAVRELLRQARQASHAARDLARGAAASLAGGTARAAEAGASMAALASRVEEVGDIVSRIGSASAERARDLAGVNQAIVRMDEMSQQGSRMVEAAALAARALQQQALDLSRTVDVFRLDEAVHGADGGSDAALPATPEGHLPGRPGRAGHLRLASSRGRGTGAAGRDATTAALPDA